MKSEKGSVAVGLVGGLFGILFFLAIIFSIIFAFSLWTDRSLEWLLDWLKPENTAHFPWWLSFLVTILLPAALAFNVIVEVIRIVVA